MDCAQEDKNVADQTIRLRVREPTFSFENMRRSGAFGIEFRGTVVDTTKKNTPICLEVTWDREDETASRELELLRNLQIRGKEAIVKITCSESGPIRCIVMEKEDGTLEDLLTLSRHSLGLPTQAVLDLMRDLARSLKFLSANGIFHSDITPSSIFCYFNHASKSIMKRYNFMLGDIPPSQPIGNVDRSGLLYKPPRTLARFIDDEEQRNEKNGDLWSLGIILFRCATGRFPFQRPPFRPKIAYRQGKYEREIESDIHPRWFLDAMTTIIRLLLTGENFMNVIELMGQLAKLRSRMIYNARRNVFCLNHPKLNVKYRRLMQEWTAKPVLAQIKEPQGMCVMNERSEVHFLQTDVVDDEGYCSSNASLADLTAGASCVEMYRRRQRTQQAKQICSKIGEFPGHFLIVSEPRLEGLSSDTMNQAEIKQIDDNVASLPLEVSIAIAHYDLRAIQMYMSNLRRLANTIESQRNNAIERLATLYHDEAPGEMRCLAVQMLMERTPEQWRLDDILSVATNEMEGCLQNLDTLEKRVVATSRDQVEEMRSRRLEVAKITKDIAIAQLRLQDGVVEKSHAMRNSLKAIVDFNKVADSMEANDR